MLAYTKNFLNKEPCKNATLFLNKTATRFVKCSEDELLGNGFNMALSYILTNVRQWSSQAQDIDNLASIRKGLQILSSDEFERVERIFHEVNNGVVDLQNKIASTIETHFAQERIWALWILIGLVLNSIVVSGFLVLIIVSGMKR